MSGSPGLGVVFFPTGIFLLELVILHIKSYLDNFSFSFFQRIQVASSFLPMMRPALCKAHFPILLLFVLLRNPIAFPLAITQLQIHLSQSLHIGCQLDSIEQFRPFHVIGLSCFHARFSICLRWPLLSFMYALGLACATASIPEVSFT